MALSSGCKALNSINRILSRKAFHANKDLHDSLWSQLTFSRSITTSKSFKMHSEPGTPGPVEIQITDKLKKAFQPLTHLQVLNESYMHNVPKGSETHFKVVVVSNTF